ncbi:sialidase family protein [Halorussus ruber]|uniref:sialidase family protein n=1 Tax=Halorussus ruber TaxID=1126238 RepID=UPI001092EC24|nr:sialidase family protein [Halorussus ruber]
MSEYPKSTSEVPNRTHDVVYRSDDEYCAFPFLGGLWKFGDGEILTAFFTIDCDYSVRGQGEHERLGRFGSIRGMRSFDSGRTWVEDGEIADLPEVADTVMFGLDARPTSFDLNDDETILASFSAPHQEPSHNHPWFMISNNKGQEWTRAFPFPKFEFKSVYGQPNYVTRPDGACLLMMPVIRDDLDHDQQRPAVFASFDGGSSWSFLSFITEKRSYGMIHPSPLVLPDGTILAAVRANPESDTAWTEIYQSEDKGRSWSRLSRPNDHGAPGTLTLLDDGRILLVYGYRKPSYGVRCRISEDGGKSWGKEWIIRQGGGSVDLGYPRTIQLSDGKVLTVYYFNEKEAEVSLRGTGVRYIASTIFEAPS